jgi:hypothetical protein
MRGHVVKRIALLALCGLLAVASAGFAESSLELERRLKRHVCVPPYRQFTLEKYSFCHPDTAECEKVVDHDNMIIIRYNAWIRHC